MAPLPLRAVPLKQGQVVDFVQAPALASAFESGQAVLQSLPLLPSSASRELAFVVLQAVASVGLFAVPSAGLLAVPSAGLLAVPSAGQIVVVRAGRLAEAWEHRSSVLQGREKYIMYLEPNLSLSVALVLHKELWVEQHKNLLLLLMLTFGALRYMNQVPHKEQEW